jgi:hypothetical protein
MGNVTGRSEPEVHVVLVQSKENRQVDAKVVRQTYRNLRSQRKIAEVYPVDSDEELSHPPVSQTYRSSKKSVIQKHSNAARPQTDTSTSSATPNQPWHTMRYDEGWRKTRYMYMYINVWS